MTEAQRMVLRKVTEQFDTAVRDLQSMINIPSVGPWFEEPEGVTGEGEIQRFLRERLESLGATVDEWEPSADELVKYEGGPGYFRDRDFSGRPNLVGYFGESDPKKPTLMFLGHCDVVPGGADWTVTTPFESRIRNNRIYGRGACDMKGGMAASLAAIRAVISSGLPLRGDISFASVTEEETGGMGTLALVDRGYRPAAGTIIPEPTSLKIAPLCRGILWGEITVRGRSGHIEIEQPEWNQGGAVDAIAYGRKLLNAIDDMNEEWRSLSTKTHKYMPIPCQVNVAEIDAGTYPSSWADSFTIRFDAQYLPSELDEYGGGGVVRSQIEDMVRDFVGDDPWLTANPPEVRWLVDADCGETSDQERIVQAPWQVMTGLDMRPVIEGVTSHTDMGLPIKVGTPTITFGPGALNIAHQPDEYLDLAEFRKAIEVFALTIVELCGRIDV